MLPNRHLVDTIWSFSPTGTAYIETKDSVTSTWSQEVFWPHSQPDRVDLYFTPLKFNGKRANANAVDMGVLFADLDPVYPADISPLPSLAWETSPGMYQAVWYLSKPVSNYDKWASVNQRLTYHLKADKGGWMGSKLLRWPGSLNWKRFDGKVVPVGQMIMVSEITYDFDELDAQLPPISRPGPLIPASAAHPTPLTPSDREWLLRRNWEALSLRGRSMITKSRVSDRSLHIVRTIHELLACGLSDDQTFHMVWVQPWNKWRTDRHAPGILWKEVQLAKAVIEG